MSFRALTIGDGDLSFSLALKRAYPQISVTATTLVESPAELFRTYSNAVTTSKEFQEKWKEQIVYGCDATNIEEKIVDEKGAEKMDNEFDIVLFNHPHLGDATLLESEQRHAERHHVLLSHYFFSAKKILKEGGRIHLCLCGSQPKTWKLMKAAENNSLHCIIEESTAYPIEKWLFTEQKTFELADVQSHYPTKRKYRNGKLGSKHFLARYGYRHRRTEGDLFVGSETEINVEQSINFIFQVDGEACKSYNGCRENVCDICKFKFDDEKQLREHLNAPALPDIAIGSFVHEKVIVNQEVQEGQSEPTSREQSPVLPSFTPLDISDAKILVEAKVGRMFDSKRIKWLCRQDKFALSKFLKSKKECTDAIRKGRVYVNQAVAMDDSRIVRENDTIALVEEYESVNNAFNSNGDGNNSEVEERSKTFGVTFLKETPFHHSNDKTLIVAYKPVGIRCVGSFSSNTLEMITKKHVESNRRARSVYCLPISKLDTGCAGLCALVTSENSIEKSLASSKIVYSFSVLVHGTPGEEWRSGAYVKVPTNSLRLWKRQKTNLEEINDTNADSQNPALGTSSDPVLLSTVELDLDDALFIRLKESFQFGSGEENSITTLTVQSRHDDGRLANVISYVLRKLGYPVVNDRFAKREFSSLPRRMKNLLKQKICIGCYCICVDFEGSNTTVSMDSHKRTQSSYWREILSS